jgi:hypothetical protein
MAGFIAELIGRNSSTRNHYLISGRLGAWQTFRK